MPRALGDSVPPAQPGGPVFPSPQNHAMQPQAEMKCILPVGLAHTSCHRFRASTGCLWSGHEALSPSGLWSDSRMSLLGEASQSGSLWWSGLPPTHLSAWKEANVSHHRGCHYRIMAKPPPWKVHGGWGVWLMGSSPYQSSYSQFQSSDP